MDLQTGAAEVGRRMLHAALLASVILFTQPAAALECVVSAEMLAAHSSVREVSSEVERLKAQGFEPASVQCVELSGGCGFAGCAGSVLVVQSFRTPGVNPQWQSVLGRVNYAPSGEFSGAERASLVALELKYAEPVKLRLEERHRAGELESKPDVRPEHGTGDLNGGGPDTPAK